MKALAVTFAQPLAPNAPPTVCRMACPASAAVWTLLSRLKKTDAEQLHGGLQCAKCRRWVNITDLNPKSEEPVQQ